ncbi:hypothetical protein Csa_020375 [Cucumis sativus]|uniref:Uncharacterized protein n=1 Tax=Cucumis sativus TaxID=3659 RepID=A0A0A0K0L3_CUCSA|nr:hypothetical protein Csa_020375 [Cucumis sativus]
MKYCSIHQLEPFTFAILSFIKTLPCSTQFHFSTFEDVYGTRSTTFEEASPFRVPQMGQEKIDNEKIFRHCSCMAIQHLLIAGCTTPTGMGGMKMLTF